jgi:hypothetical protein
MFFFSKILDIFLNKLFDDLFANKTVYDDIALLNFLIFWGTCLGKGYYNYLYSCDSLMEPTFILYQELGPKNLIFSPKLKNDLVDEWTMKVIMTSIELCLPVNAIRSREQAKLIVDILQSYVVKHHMFRLLYIIYCFGLSFFYFVKNLPLLDLYL